MKESKLYKEVRQKNSENENIILVEAKKRRIKEVKDEIFHIENRLAIAKDRLMICENELKELI